MTTNFKELAEVLPRGIWMSASVIEQKYWGKDISRKYRIQQLVKKGLLLRKGNTGNTLYKVADKTAKPTSAPALASPGSLNELINAVTKVGTENELLKKGLIEIQTIVNRTLLTL